MTPERNARERRLLAAAQLLIGSDDPAVGDLLPAVDACADGPARDLVLGQLAWQAGDVGEAAYRLQRASGSSDDRVAVEALARLAAQMVTLSRGQAAIDAATEAIDRGIDDERLERQTWALLVLGVAATTTAQSPASNSCSNACPGRRSSSRLSTRR